MKLQRPVGSRERRGLDIRLRSLGLLPGMLGSHGRVVSRGEAGAVLWHVQDGLEEKNQKLRGQRESGVRAQIREGEA